MVIRYEEALYQLHIAKHFTFTQTQREILCFIHDFVYIEDRRSIGFIFRCVSTEQTSRQLVIDYILSSGENYVDVFDVST